MKEKILKIDKLTLLLGEIREKIKNLQDEHMREETLYKRSLDYISHKEYEEYLVRHNNISDQINMLLKTYAAVSTEVSRVCLILI